MKRVAIGKYSRTSGWQSNPAVLRQPEPEQIRTKKKKSRLSKKRVFAVLFLMVLFMCGILFFNFAHRVPGLNLPNIQSAQSLCTNILDPKCWTASFKPQLEQTDGLTNVLIIGLDTRAGDSGLKNTDTLAVLSFNHETQESMIISVPRDFYSQKYATRINAVYAFTMERDPSDPFRYLKEEMSAIIGHPIHYYATIRFDAFKDIIDEFNGIEICPEAAFTAQYPNESARNGGSQWLYYDFEEGCQTVTGERALIYARFRYVSKGPSSLASDFSRARRQQEVIEAVKDKIVAQDLSVSEKANNYWKLFQNYQDNVDSNVGFTDILAGLSYLDTADRDPVNIVLDPNFVETNKIIYTDTSSGAYLIRPRDASYKQINTEIEKISQNSDLYKENSKILVKNWGKTYLSSAHPVQKLEEEIVYKQSYSYVNEFGKADFTGYKVIDFSEGEKPATLKLIMDSLSIDGATDQLELDVVQSKAEEDFLIIVGLPEPTPTLP